jgi:hypothetical protein
MEQQIIPQEVVEIILEFISDDFLLSNIENSLNIFKKIIQNNFRKKIKLIEQISDENILKITSNHKNISNISLENDNLDNSESYLTHKGIFHLCESGGLFSALFLNISFGFESINVLSFVKLKELSLINCKIDFEDPVFNQNDVVDLFESVEILTSPNCEIVKYFKNLRKLTVYTMDIIFPDLSKLLKLEDFTLIGFHSNSALNFHFLRPLKDNLNILTFKNCKIPVRIANYLSRNFSLKELNFIEGTKFVGEKNYEGNIDFDDPNDLFDIGEAKSTIKTLRIHTNSFVNDVTLKNISTHFPDLNFISLINQNIVEYYCLNYCENIFIKNVNMNVEFMTTLSMNFPKKIIPKSDFVFCKQCKHLINKQNYKSHCLDHWGENLFHSCPNINCKFISDNFSKISNHLKFCPFYQIVCHGCKEIIKYQDFHLHKCEGIHKNFVIKKVKLLKFYEEKNGKMVNGICKLLEVEDDTIIRWRRY